jgi:hypothetical protein
MGFEVFFWVGIGLFVVGSMVVVQTVPSYWRLVRQASTGELVSVMIVRTRLPVPGEMCEEPAEGECKLIVALRFSHPRTGQALERELGVTEEMAQVTAGDVWEMLWDPERDELVRAEQAGDSLRTLRTSVAAGSAALAFGLALALVASFVLS